MKTNLYSRATFIMKFFTCFLIAFSVNNISAPAQMKRVAAVGSSTTYGVGSSPIDSSWVRRFSYYYKHQMGVIDTIFNLGVSGYTCYYGMPSSYTHPAGRPAPDPSHNITEALTLLDSTSSDNGVIIVNFPSNGYDTYTIPEIMTSLQTIYDSAVLNGYKCYITTTQPRSSASFNTSAMRTKMYALKDSILNRFGPTYTLDFYDGMYNPADSSTLSAYSAGDGIHFNNAGHREIFNRVVAKNVFDPASTGDYRSVVAAGFWGDITTWQRYDGIRWVAATMPPDGTIGKIFILSGDSITLSGYATANNIDMQPGARITLKTDAALQVSGSISGSGNIYGGGTLVFNGGAAQAIGGIVCANNVTINNIKGVTVAPASRLTIKKQLSMAAGTLFTNDSLVLASDSISTAFVSPVQPGAAITGKVQVRQYVTGGRRAFRFWGHPFDSAIALRQIENYIDITGSGGTAHGFTHTPSDAPSAFLYNPLHGNSSIGYDPGWRAFTDCNGTNDSNLFHKYQGIRLFIRGSKGQGLDGHSYTPSPATISMIGNLNQGNQYVVLSKGTDSNQDYNQISNPYPSPVDIGTVTYNAKQAGKIVGSAVYVWDPYMGSVGQFVAIPITDGSPYAIQAYTSFQVRAAHNNDTLLFQENNKFNNDSLTLLRQQHKEQIVLKVYDASYNLWDKCTLQFNDRATDAEDDMYDARKLSGPSGFEFYAIAADNNKMAIDTRRYAQDKVIPLGVSSDYIQDFIIKADDVNLPDSNNVYLYDKMLNKYQQLTAGTEYKFSIAKDPQTQGNKRFELRLMQETTTVANEHMKVVVSPNPATEYANVTFTDVNSDKVKVCLYDMSGICVYRNEIDARLGSIKIPLDKLASGIYVTEVVGGSDKIIRNLVKY